MNRSLILSILSSLPSKREAQSFLRKVKLLQDGTILPISSVGLILLQDSSSLLKSDAALVANSLSELSQLGIQPLVLLESPQNNRNSLHHHHLDSKWSRINAAFQLAEQIDVCVGPVRGIPIYSDFAQHSSELSGSTSSSLTSSSIVDLDLSQIKTHLSNGQVPILVPISFNQEFVQSSFIPSRTLLLSLCRSLTADKDLGPPVKLIVINKNGGLTSLDDPHKHQGFVNLNPEYLASLHKNNSSKWNSLKETITTIDQVLGELPSTCSAIMASCYSQSGVISNLLTEKAPLGSSTASAFSPRLEQLASHNSNEEESLRGSFPLVPSNSSNSTYISKLAPSSKHITTPPTMFRKGLSLTSFSTLSDPSLNITSLTRLIESSFTRTLNAAAFYKRLETSLAAVIIAGGDGYNGAVIVTTEHLGSSTISYLDKFAVSPTSQGLGVADLLWTRLTEDFPRFVWRSRTNNPVNKWYFDRAEGCVRAGEWVVFWRGEMEVEVLAECVEVAKRVPASFENGSAPTSV